MPESCVAINCTNRYKNGTGISFHKFPFRDKNLLKAWVKAVRRDQWQPISSSSLCSEHFEPKWFYHTNGHRKLLNLAVPTIFNYNDHTKRITRKRNVSPGYQYKDHTKKITRKKKVSPDYSNEDSSDSSSEEEKTDQVRLPPKRRGRPRKRRRDFEKIKPTVKVDTVSTSKNNLNVSNPKPSSVTRCKKVLHEKQSKNNQENVPDDCLANASGKDTPLHIFKSKDNPLHIFTSALGLNHVEPQKPSKPNQLITIEGNKCAEDFESIFPELKARLKSEQGSLIIDSCFTSVIRDLLKDPINNKKVTEYSKSMKRLASTVHFYSREAYDYLRSFAKLPHPSTLFHWATVSGGKPGFTDESFVQAAKQVKAVQAVNDDNGNGGKMYCCLVVDEMQIRKQLDFDGKEVVGYCDLGHGDLSDDNVPIAKEALVFMGTAINRNWKMPLGYCLVDGLGGSVRANLVRMYLQKLHEVGVECVALACDGTGLNLSMLNELGVSLNSESRKNWFVHPCDSGRKVYSFFDAANMIKALRNLIAERGMIIDSRKEKGSNQIEWKFFENLCVLQERVKEEEKGIAFDGKSSLNHSENAESLTSYKEKYGMTEEMLGTSVSLSLQICESMDIVEFRGSSATAEFASKIDEIFDLLNSSYIFASGSKSPVMKKNKYSIMNNIRDAIKYLEGLKIPGPEKPMAIINGPKKIGVLGLIFNLLSVKNLAEELVWGSPAPLMGLLTAKLCQGNLESLFENIRKHAGDVWNPTAVEFRTAYRKCVIQGACIPNKATVWTNTVK